MNRFNLWVSYLKVVSLIFALMGVMWAVIGSFDPFGIYDSLMAEAFFNTTSLPSEASRVFRFILAPFGATSAGYFILQYYLTRYAFARRERWAYNATASAFFFWFFLDTALSMWHGAFFNIALANIPSLLAMLPPLLLTRREFFRY